MFVDYSFSIVFFFFLHQKLLYNKRSTKSTLSTKSTGICPTMSKHQINHFKEATLNASTISSASQVLEEKVTSFPNFSNYYMPNESKPLLRAILQWFYIRFKLISLIL